MASPEKYCSTSEAAGILGVTERHVRWLIARGTLRALKVGRAHILARRDLPGFNRQRKRKVS